MIYLVLSTDVDTGNMVDPFNQPDTCWNDMNRKVMFILGLAWVVFIVRVMPVQWVEVRASQRQTVRNTNVSFWE